MAHLGCTREYYQAITAQVKAREELMASFPLSKSPFGRLELSETECRRFHTQATELLGKALKDYEEFVLIRHRKVDRQRWKSIKSHNNIEVYRESRSYIVSRSLGAEDDDSLAPSSSSGHRRCASHSSSSSGDSGSGSISLPAHQVTELELLTGWGPTAKEARKQKERAKNKSVSLTGHSEQLPTLLGVGNIVGSLDDVMYSVAAPDCASMALKHAYSHEDVLDGDVLAAIEGPSQRSPFRFLGIKWLVKSAVGGNPKHKIAFPRDLVYLEATGVITRGDGVRIGYQIIHSVKLRGCPELVDSHGVVRAQYESAHLFIELNNKKVDVFLKSSLMKKGRVSESAALHSCATSLLYCGKAVQNSQKKKLMWQLECSGHLQSVHKQQKKNKAAECSVCNKTFSRFLRQSLECKLCSSAMCSKCCVERTLKSIDTSGDNRHTNKSVVTLVVELCTNCITTNVKTSALMLAREEVACGRYGRLSDSSLFTSGQHQDSNNSRESIDTIDIEDIPGQREHHTRPPRRSEGSTQRCYHPRSRECRRSQREESMHHDDPERDNGGKGHEPQFAHPDVSEPALKRGHAHRKSSLPYAGEHQEMPKLRTRSVGQEPTNPNLHARPPTFRRGRSGEVHRHMSRTEDDGKSEHFKDRSTLPGSIQYGRHRHVYEDTPIELEDTGKGGQVDLCDLDTSPYKFSKGSIRITTSSSGSSLEGIDTAGVVAEEPEVEEDDMKSRGTFDSFGDLIDTNDDVDDVYETLDTKDMAAVKRTSQVNRKLWQQIADLRDTAENTYQYTKESTAMHITQGGAIRSSPLRFG